MTKNQAIALYDSGEWKNWSDVEKVRAQLFEERLLMPFAEFQHALQRVLGRTIWTHDFGDAAKVEQMKTDFLDLHPAA